MDVATLPDPDPSDSSETRWALETARTLWGQGERREALQWIRRAAEAAAESGQDDRALLLAKQGAELRNVMDIPRTLPPPAPTGAPVPRSSSASSPSLPSLAGMTPKGFGSAKPPVSVLSVSPSPPARPAEPLSKSVEPPLTHAAEQTAKSVVPPPTSVAPSSAPSITVAPTSTTSVIPNSGRITVPPPSERGDEIVVTVIANDGSFPTPDASLVSRRAVRVAVIAVDAPNELRVKKLAPGEVAPKDSTVALLVAFEPGASPVPEN